MGGRVLDPPLPRLPSGFYVGAGPRPARTGALPVLIRFRRGDKLPEQGGALLGREKGGLGPPFPI